MKKRYLILLTLVPLLLGYIINITTLIPNVGSTLYYILPSLNIMFWFFLGYLYSKSDWNALASIIIGNAVGILSLLAYVWQFVLVSAEARNMTISGFSQYFTVAAPSFLLGDLPMIFEVEPNYIGRGAMLGVVLFSLILMIIIFAGGYIFGKIRRKQMTLATQ